METRWGFAFSITKINPGKNSHQEMSNAGRQIPKAFPPTRSVSNAARRCAFPVPSLNLKSRGLSITYMNAGSAGAPRVLSHRFRAKSGWRLAGSFPHSALHRLSRGNPPKSRNNPQRLTFSSRRESPRQIFTVRGQAIDNDLGVLHAPPTSVARGSRKKT